MERLALAFLPEGGVRVTVTHRITRPSATANPALDTRLEETRQALAARPGFVEARYNLSLLLAKMGRFDDAAAELRKLVAGFPDSAHYHFSLAEVLFLAKRYADSVEEYAQAARLEPNNPRNWHALANAEEKAGRTEEAKEHRQKALSIK